MKRSLILLICWACTLSIFAQDTQTSTTSSNSNEIHTLFNKGSGTCKIPLGYFIEMDAGYTHFGHKSVLLPGISMGLILDHHWTIGMTGNFIMNSQGSNHHHSESDSIHTGKHESSNHGGYGGLLLEYTLFPRSKFHVSFPLIIGGGYIATSHHMEVNDSISSPSHKYWSHHGESFFVLEPGVKLEVNVVKNLRIGLGISYRYSPEKNHRITSPDMLNQLTGKLTFRFGKF
jgi:hypothetical protein